jgi:hypothetical protein
VERAAGDSHSHRDQRANNTAEYHLMRKVGRNVHPRHANQRYKRGTDNAKHSGRKSGPARKEMKSETPNEADKLLVSHTRTLGCSHGLAGVQHEGHAQRRRNHGMSARRAVPLLVVIGVSRRQVERQERES